MLGNEAAAELPGNPIPKPENVNLSNRNASGSPMQIVKKPLDSKRNAQPDTRRSQIDNKFGAVASSPGKMAPLHSSSGGYKLTIEEMFKDKAMTFEDIEKLNIDVFAAGRGSQKKKSDAAEFRPSDILDIDDNDSDSDEILRRFKTNQKNTRNKLSPSTLKKKAA